MLITEFVLNQGNKVWLLNIRSSLIIISEWKESNPVISNNWTTTTLIFNIYDIIIWDYMFTSLNLKFGYGI